MSVFKKGGAFNYVKFYDIPMEYGQKWYLHFGLFKHYLTRGYITLANKHLVLAEKYEYCFKRAIQGLLAEINRDKHKSYYGRDYSDRQQLLKEMLDFAAKHNIDIKNEPINKHDDCFSR